MASMSTKILTQAIRAPFFKRHGLTPGVASTATTDYKWDNGFTLKGSTATDADGPSGEVDLLGVDSDNIVRVGGTGFKGSSKTVTFKLATGASIVSQNFWICPYTSGARVTKIECSYATADGAAITGSVKKVADGDPMAAGVSLHAASTSFDMNTTTNTPLTATLATDGGVVDLAYKDRLSFVLSAVRTSLAGLVVTVTMSPGNKGETVTYSMMANGDLIDQNIFIANRPMKVAKILQVHSVKSTGATNLQVEKCTGTTAAGSGTVLLTNDTDAGFETDAVADTVQTGALTVTASQLRLAVKDRLALDFNGTLTGLAGVIVTVLFEPTYDRREIAYSLSKNANLGTQSFFIADRDYEVVAASCSWATAAASGNTQVTIDKVADAPGAGTDLISDDTNSGFATDGTANTVALGGFISGAVGSPNAVLLAGDRLSVKPSVTTTMVDLTVVVSLKPC